MRRLLLTASLAVLVLLVLSSCSHTSAPPKSHRLARAFAVSSQSTRLFERYNYRASVQIPAWRIRLPAGTRQLSVHLDCKHADGTVHVDVPVFGGAGADCRATGDGSALVVLETGRVDKTRQGNIKVTAPHDSRWSIAVDASSRRS